MDRTYPHGVTSWVDTAQPDVNAAREFYGGLFGWTFADAMPPDAPDRYVIAALDGRDAAAIASTDQGPARWRTYVAVDDCDATTQRMAGLGAAVVHPPADAGPGGRTSTLTDPEGAEVHLWQARRRLGVQVANEPGAWNFSDLATADPVAAANFYTAAFGWDVADQGWSTAIRVPGYGDHLESTVDPDIRVRQAGAPEGFADAIGGAVGLEDGEKPHWHVTFSIADRDESARLAESLGATVLSTREGMWANTARIRDPWGAELTLSQFVPPS